MKWIATSPAASWHEKAPQPTKASPQLTVTDSSQQTIEGFGGCFNEIGWQTLQALAGDRRRHVLRDLFDPTSGCGFRLCRVPIGANDFALEWYSHDEHDGDFAMDHFSIERDRCYLIPYIRAAMSIQPDLRLFASPWSPPTWMKQPRAYNSGMLRWEPEILEAYAQDSHHHHAVNTLVSSVAPPSLRRLDQTKHYLAPAWDADRPFQEQVPTRGRKRPVASTPDHRASTGETACLSQDRPYTPGPADKHGADLETGVVHRSGRRRGSRWHRQGFISNPFRSCVFGTWRGQASPLHFQQESTGFDIKLFWKYKSRATSPTPRISQETVTLIQEMARDNRRLLSRTDSW